MRALIALAALALAACSHGSGGGYIPLPPTDVISGSPGNPMNPALWQIGPVINGQNLSSGATIQPHAQGWVLEIPQPPGSAHYITMPTGPLNSKNGITMKFRVEGEGRIVPTDLPQLTGMLTLYFERAGLCWTAACETARWYSVTGRVRPLLNGEYTVTGKFTEPWSAVLTTISTGNPAAFADTLANAGRVGFVLGGGNGVGHGVHATGPARIVVTSFVVE